MLLPARHEGSQTGGKWRELDRQTQGLCFRAHGVANFRFLRLNYCVIASWDSSVGIATGWTAGVRFPAEARNYFSVSGAHPASYPYCGALFPGVKGRNVKLTTHFHLVPRSRKAEIHSPIRLHGVALNYLSTGALPLNYCVIKNY
jgi:hypothetical protein